MSQKSSFLQGDEILVVDNNSNDNTRELVESFFDVLPLRYVFEPKQGLSAARNRVLVESNADIIVFIDDDISVSQSFIAEYQRAFQDYPDAGFFGGKINVDWCGAAPSWYRDDSLPLINGLIGHYDLGDRDLLYKKNDLLPYGANFALRSETANQVGKFDENLGVNGEKLDRGEETDYFLRAIGLGLTGHYIANASVGHRFEISRIRISYLYAYGLAKGRFNSEYDKQSRLTNTETSRQTDVSFYFRQSIYAAKACFQLVKGRRDRFYQSMINLGIRRGVYLRSRGL